MFKIYAILSILFVVLAIIFLLLTILFKIKQKENRGFILGTIATLLCTFSTFIASINVSVPAPVIYPLDNETHIYSEDIEVIIKSNEMNSSEIYYSLDGDDPKNKYKNPITISKTTTVSARSKFLWCWSEINKSSYKFKTDTDDKSPISRYSIDELKFAKIKSMTLNVRAEPNLYSDIVALVVQDENYIVLQTVVVDNITWYKIFIDDDIYGYVVSEFVEISTYTG